MPTLPYSNATPTPALHGATWSFLWWWSLNTCPTSSCLQCLSIGFVSTCLYFIIQALSSQMLLEMLPCLCLCFLLQEVLHKSSQMMWWTSMPCTALCEAGPTITNNTANIPIRSYQSIKCIPHLYWPVPWVPCTPTHSHSGIGLGWELPQYQSLSP